MAAKNEACPSPLGYVWRVDILPSKVAEFRQQFADLSRFNEILPEGARFTAVYETFIGRRDEPRFQIWFQLPDLATLEDPAMQKAVSYFHQELQQYLDPNRNPWNEIVRAVE
ncbi:MAG TPA: hypothetical protein VG897_18505 [Terriglobales bacterium]|nr:hypothetical protein [Terriglobales bacterium]